MRNADRILSSTEFTLLKGDDIMKDKIKTFMTLRNIIICSIALVVLIAGIMTAVYLRYETIIEEEVPLDVDTILKLLTRVDVVADCNAVVDDGLDDSQAIISALNQAQKEGKIAFFPKGVYEFNLLNYSATGELVIMGEEGTVFHNPGTITLRNNSHVQNVIIIKDDTQKDKEHVFLLSPTGYADYEFDNITIVGPGGNNTIRGIYSYTSDSNGINNLTITNSSFNGMAMAIAVSSYINGGLIDNNVITDIGDEKHTGGAVGIQIGSNNHIASNVIISNNEVRNILNESSYQGSDESASYYAYGILAYGRNITIDGNTVENLLGGAAQTAIYTKATESVISNNSVHNGGDYTGNIVCKIFPLLNEDHTSIKVINNTITTDRELTYVKSNGIRINNSQVVVEGNTIDYDGMPILLESGETLISADIIDNNITTKYGMAIYVLDIDGELNIRGNNITQNYSFAESAPSSTELAYGAIRVYGASSSTSINVSENKVDVINGTRAFTLGGLSKDTHASVTNNEFTSPNVGTHSVSVDKAIAEISNNTITITEPSMSISSTSQSFVNIQESNGESFIENNTLVLEGGIINNCLNVKTSNINITENYLFIEEGTSANSFLLYSPATVDSSEDNTIAGNEFYVSGTLTYGMVITSSVELSTMEIAQNNVIDGIISTRLIQASPSSQKISSSSGMLIADNYVITKSSVNPATTANIVSTAQIGENVVLSLYENDSPPASTLGSSSNTVMTQEEEEAAKRAEEERIAEEERLAAEEAAKSESERLAQEAEEEARIEAERLEAERIAQEAEEAAKAEAERLEAERLEEERLAAEAEEAARAEEEILAQADEEAAKQAEAEAEDVEAPSNSSFTSCDISYDSKGYLVVTFCEEVKSVNTNKSFKINGKTYKATMLNGTQYKVDIVQSKISIPSQLTISDVQYKSSDKKTKYEVSKYIK